MVEHDGWYHLHDDDPLFIALHGADLDAIDAELDGVVRTGVDLSKVVHGHHETQPLLEIVVNNAPPGAAKLLLKHGFDPNAPDVFGEPPLFKIDLMTTEVVEAFLVAGARVNATTVDGRTPLFRACYDPVEIPTVQVLLDAGVDVRAIDEHGQIALHEATSNDGDPTELVRLLLDAGSPVDLADRDERTPLLNAAQCGHVATVQLLLERGASPGRVVMHPSFPVLVANDAQALVRIAAERTVLRDAAGEANGGKADRRRL